MSAADKFNRQVPSLGVLQPKLTLNFAYQTHVTVIFIGPTSKFWLLESLAVPSPTLGNLCYLSYFLPQRRTCRPPPLDLVLH